MIWICSKKLHLELKKFCLKLLSSVILFIVVLGSVVGLTPSLRGYVLHSSYIIKEFYINRKDDLQDFLYSYIGQAEKIYALQQQVKELEAVKLKYQMIKRDMDNLYRTVQMHGGYNILDANLVKVLSYASFGNYTKVWLDFNSQNIDKRKIYGLIQDGVVVGIAKEFNNHLIGILNGDSECSYSVYVGENKVPGIARFEGNQMLIDYIPSWMSIKDGDEVVTSGLDGVFYSDIKVGMIENVRVENGHIRANLLPYINKVNLSYIWLIDTKIPQLITLDQNMILNNAELYGNGRDLSSYDK